MHLYLEFCFSSHQKLKAIEQIYVPLNSMDLNGCMKWNSLFQ
jgi:hypothetical protein